MPKNDLRTRDNLKTRERELWRDGGIIERFSERQIGSMIEENKRIGSTVVVPPFGSLDPYRPKGESDAE